MLVQVVLTYQSATNDPPVVIGSTVAPDALRVVRDAIMSDLGAEAGMLEGVDAAAAVGRVRDASRLARVLAVLVPDQETRRKVENGGGVVPLRRGKRLLEVVLREIHNIRHAPAAVHTVVQRYYALLSEGEREALALYLFAHCPVPKGGHERHGTF